MNFNVSVRTRTYAGIPMRAEINNNGFCNAITSVSKDTMIMEVYEICNPTGR